MKNRMILNFIVVSLLCSIFLINVFANCSGGNFCPIRPLNNTTAKNNNTTKTPKSVFTTYKTKKNIWKLLISGIVLGVSDGILNPCVLSLILVMTVYLFSIGSRKRVLKCGVAFVLSVAFVYYVIVLLIVTTLNTIGYQIQFFIIPILALVLLVFGLLEIKEYFSGKSPLKLPDFIKPKIEKYIKQGTIVSSVIVGSLSTFLNLGCTGTFPLAYALILREYHFPLALNMVFVFWYVMWFILPLMAIVLGYYIGTVSLDKIKQFYETKKRYMRLVSGVILLGFAVYLLFPYFITPYGYGHIEQYKVLIFYSTTCPHCHHLIDVLEHSNISSKCYKLICVNNVKGYELWLYYCKKVHVKAMYTPTVLVKENNGTLAFVGFSNTNIGPEYCLSHGYKPVKIFNCSTCYVPGVNAYIMTKPILLKVCRC